MNLEGKIPLIHIYCDNWCERCPFSDRCEMFAREQAWRDSKDSVTDNDVFEFVEKNLSEALEKMMAYIEEKGIDLAAETDEEEDQTGATPSPNPELLEELIQISGVAKKYGSLSLKWIIDKNTMFEGYRDMLLQRQELGLAVDEYEVAELANAVEEIQWYSHFVGAKVHRIADQLQEPFYNDDIQSDANGSAKVVLIAIGRSIKSWEIMMRDFPEKMDEIITFLSSLQRLQAVIQRLFPNAEAFHRPGFDD